MSSSTPSFIGTSSSSLQADPEVALELTVEESIGLAWSGTLVEKDLSRLKEQFGQVILLPGQRIRLPKSDDEGLVFVPGAIMGYSDSKRIMQKWKEKAEKATGDVQWWRTYLHEKGTEPLYLHHLLNGLRSKQWSEYRRLFRKATSIKRSRRYREEKQRKFKTTRLEEKRERAQRAASTLLSLTVARSS